MGATPQSNLFTTVSAQNGRIATRSKFKRGVVRPGTIYFVVTPSHLNDFFVWAAIFILNTANKLSSFALISEL